MKQNPFGRIVSALLGAVLALCALTPPGFIVGGEEPTEPDNPTLYFQNEKYDGIKVFKNIYTNDEYYKEDRRPIRVTNPEPGDIYDINDLGYDEFRLVLYGADDKDELYNANDRPPMDGVKFQRKLGSLLYYNLKLHQNGKDLILAPYDISDYFLYYSGADGTIEIVFDSRTSYFTHSDIPAKDRTQEQIDEAAAYAALNYHEKYLRDGAYYTANGTAAQKAVFAGYSGASPDFYTGSDGSFYIFDGDIVYFDESVLDKKYVRVKESWESVRDLNAERKNSENYSHYTGEYIYMIGDDVVTDVIASSQSGSLEVANRFDEPSHELTVSKTVPFFGVAPSDVNPFRTSDVFEYKLLINNKTPASIQYTLLDTKTNRRYPTASEAGQTNVTETASGYRYVAENGVFSLYAEQTAIFYGVKNNDTVEIREYTNPDKYSVLSELTGNAVFRYVSASDPGNDETPPRDYASITVQYGNELNQRHNPTFTNVPNVLQVRKRVLASNIDTEREFTFTIRKLVPDPEDPAKPKKTAAGEYVIDEDAPTTYTYYVRDGDNNYDPAARTALGGVFTLRHDQTAMFTGLKADSLYLVTESGDASYNLLDGNSRVLNTRGETVEDTLIRSKSGNHYELFINERDEMKGIVLTKRVLDSDNRLNAKAEYVFRLEKLNTTTRQYEAAAGVAYSYKEGTYDLKSAETDENGYFRVKGNLNNTIVKFPTANGTYRITEVDPNDWNDQNNPLGAASPNPQHEEYLYITDVDYDIYDVRDPENPELLQNGETVTYNEDMTTHTDDIVLEGISCSQDLAASVDFTNRIREKTYYFDIEKLAYLDDNIHDGKSDPTQRFLFRIERFDTMADALKSDSTPLETFYTDLSCTEKFIITDHGSAASPQFTYSADGRNYPYRFDPIAYTYTGRGGGADSVQYADEIVTRTYQKADTAAVYENGETETYKFFSTIYRGHREVAVQKQGYYRITEICSWSNTDYDYCLCSNRYKGYLEGNTLAKNRLFADNSTITESGSVRDRSVIIYAGALDDGTYPYTLGCEYFTDTSGTVRYIRPETQEVLIQKRNDNGDLLYYETGDSGDETTEKYDSDGNRRLPVPAPDKQFRIQDIANGKLLYFDAEHTQPVYQYVSGLADDQFVQEGYPEEEDDGEGGTKTVTKQRKQAFPVYDSEGSPVEGETRFMLSDPEKESSYTHNSKVRTDTVYTVQTDTGALRPMASFSNVESEYALLSSNAWADNIIGRAGTDP